VTKKSWKQREEGSAEAIQEAETSHLLWRGGTAKKKCGWSEKETQKSRRNSKTRE
jgi:hypothetical protein